MEIERDKLLSFFDRIKETTESDHLVIRPNGFAATSEGTIYFIPFDVGFACVVPFSEFYAIVQKTKGKKFSLDRKDRALKFKSGRVKGELILVNSYPEMDLRTDQWLDLPANFIDGVRACAMSVAKDMLLAWMNVLHVIGDKIYSTDSHRISRYEIEKPLERDIAIPHPSVQSIVRSNASYVKYQLDKTWLKLLMEDDSILLLRIADDSVFPLFDHKKVDDSFANMGGVEIALPEGMAEALNKVTVMCDDQSGFKWVQISLEEGLIKIKAQKAAGWVEESIEMSYSGKLLSFRMNPEFLKIILTKTNKIVIGDRFISLSVDGFSHAMGMVVPT